MGNLLTHYQFFLWTFGHFKVPMIGYLRPKLLHLNAEEILIKIPLRRRSKNHLHSMYFGALATGADIAGGLHGYYHANEAKVRISLAFKTFQANFLKRPEEDVYFLCQNGLVVKEMIELSRQQQKRINHHRAIQAFINYTTTKELVAEFSLELSLKVV